MDWCKFNINNIKPKDNIFILGAVISGKTELIKKIHKNSFLYVFCGTFGTYDDLVPSSHPVHCNIEKLKDIIELTKHKDAEKMFQDIKFLSKMYKKFIDEHEIYIKSDYDIYKMEKKTFDKNLKIYRNQEIKKPLFRLIFDEMNILEEPHGIMPRQYTFDNKNGFFEEREEIKEVINNEYIGVTIASHYALIQNENLLNHFNYIFIFADFINTQPDIMNMLYDKYTIIRNIFNRQIFFNFMKSLDNHHGIVINIKKNKLFIF